MSQYIIRRFLYAIPILIGVNFLTFALFFMVNTPDDMARMHLGEKHLTTEAIEQWKADKGYNRPLFINNSEPFPNNFSNTILYENSLGLFTFNFGQSDEGRDIGADVSQRMWPSLAIAIPTFILGLIANIVVALLVVMFRATKIDLAAMAIAVSLMSISGLFYIIGGQYLFAKMWSWFPISGYDMGENAWKFLILPIIIGVVSGLGAGVRWYRSLFLEEVYKDYVRTAKAKGLSELSILFRHILQNAMLPILTGVVVVIPLLFMGSLLMESFFGIPGLGSYTIDAIQGQDFSIVRVMVFVGTVLYIVGLILTDISYALFDPRVRLS